MIILSTTATLSFLQSKARQLAGLCGGPVNTRPRPTIRLIAIIRMAAHLAFVCIIHPGQQATSFLRLNTRFSPKRIWRIQSHSGPERTSLGRPCSTSRPITVSSLSLTRHLPDASHLTWMVSGSVIALRSMRDGISSPIAAALSCLVSKRPPIIRRRKPCGSMTLRSPNDKVPGKAGWLMTIHWIMLRCNIDCGPGSSLTSQWTQRSACVAQRGMPVEYHSIGLQDGRERLITEMANIRCRRNWKRQFGRCGCL